MAALTDKQKKVYDYLRERMSTGLPPTVREICSRTGIKSTSTVFNILTALESEGLISRDGGSSRAIRITGSTQHVDVPMVGLVTAGTPILATENIEQYLPLPADIARGRDIFALRVRGTSMIKAGILSGDIVYAERISTAEEGDIVVALINDEATVKRLAFDKNGKAVLMPENDAFEPITADNIEILGRVIAGFRQY